MWSQSARSDLGPGLHDRDPGIVHEDVDGPEFLGDGGRQRRNGTVIGQVGLESSGSSAGRANGLHECFGFVGSRAVVDSDRSPRARERGGDSASDTTARAGHESGLATEVHESFVWKRILFTKVSRL